MRSSSPNLYSFVRIPLGNIQFSFDHFLLNYFTSSITDSYIVCDAFSMHSRFPDYKFPSPYFYRFQFLFSLRWNFPCVSHSKHSSGFCYLVFSIFDLVIILTFSFSSSSFISCIFLNILIKSVCFSEWIKMLFRSGH